MSFAKIKSWDDRKTCDQRKTVRGRTWVRRIQWLESSEGQVKLKLEDGETYKEVLVPSAFAQTVFDRFKQGQSIDDSLSVLSVPVPKSMQSKRAQS